MRSVRLDQDLDDRVRRAASAENVSVSEFLRRAADERARRMLSGKPSERLADFIGNVEGDGSDASSRTGEVWGDWVAEKHGRPDLKIR